MKISGGGALSPRQQVCGASPALGDYTSAVAPVAPVSPVSPDQPWFINDSDYKLHDPPQWTRDYVDRISFGQTLSNTDRHLLDCLVESLHQNGRSVDELLPKVIEKLDVARRGGLQPMIGKHDPVLGITVSSDANRAEIVFQTKSGNHSVLTGKGCTIDGDTVANWNRRSDLCPLVWGTGPALNVTQDDRCFIVLAAEAMRAEAMSIECFIGKIVGRVHSARAGHLPPLLSPTDRLVRLSVPPDSMRVELTFDTARGRQTAVAE